MRLKLLEIALVVAVPLGLSGCHTSARDGGTMQSGSASHNTVRASHATGTADVESDGRFAANLAGAHEVPEVSVNATGEAKFKLSPDGKEVHYVVKVDDLANVIMIHLHEGSADQNGKIVVWLYPDSPPQKLIPGVSSGTVASGTFTASRLVGPMKGKTIADLVTKMKSGDVYVQVHTKAHPEGAIRGQVHPE